MANYASGPSVQLRRLATELRALREAARLSRQQVMEQTGINDVTLYRIESGKTRPQHRTLNALLDIYNADDPKRERLNELAATTRFPGWMRPYRSLLGETVISYLTFEAEASSLHSYESMFVPGLLQTHDYVRAMMRAALPLATEEGIEARVQARLDRQARVAARTNPLRLWLIVDEAALRRRIGSTDVMSAQLASLLEATDRPEVTLQVIPFSQGAYPGMTAPFVRLQFDKPADTDIVCTESMAGMMYLDSPDEVQKYSQLFDHQRATALSPSETIRHIAGVLDEVR